MKKKYNILCCIIFLFVIASCDPISSVEYRIYNFNSEIVTIELKKRIEYDIYHEDSVKKHYASDDNIVELEHYDFLELYYEWMNNRAKSHTPLWEDISSIHIGDSIIPHTYWNNVENWEVRSRSEIHGESIKYYLYLK